MKVGLGHSVNQSHPRTGEIKYHREGVVYKLVADSSFPERATHPKAKEKHDRRKESGVRAIVRVVTQPSPIIWWPIST